MKNVIEVENVTKKYRSTVALNNINLQIHEGDIYGLIGRNGAGKSSLLRILCGQSTQYSGNIKIFGKAIEQAPDERSKLGALIEHPAFYPELTGRKNLEYYQIQKGLSQKNCIEKVLNDLDLVNIADRKFKHYSLGNKQQLGIALALLNDPKILILDEPTNGLDPIGIKEIRKFLLAINKAYNTTIIISSHILSELEHLVTRIGFIDKGRMIKELDIEEFKNISENSINLKVTNHERVYLLLKNKLHDSQVTLSEYNNLKISGSNIDLSEITRIVLEANEKIQSVNENTDSLEDYFIHLVGAADHEELLKK